MVILIKKITIDSKGVYQKSEIVSKYSNVNDALEGLHIAVKILINDLYGTHAVNNYLCEIVSDINKIIVPENDGITAVQNENDNTKIYVYVKKTIINKETGWLWNGVAIFNNFFINYIYEMENFDIVKMDINGIHKPLVKELKNKPSIIYSNDIIKSKFTFTDVITELKNKHSNMINNY